MKTLKKLETIRLARLKKASTGMAAVIKRADVEARRLVLEDLRDVTQTVVEVAQTVVEEDDKSTEDA